MSTDRKAWSALAACAVALALCASTPLAAGYHADDPEYDYTFGWDSWRADVYETEGETAENETREVPVEVNRGNLTRVTFNLTWTDDLGDPDTLEMRVTAPDGSQHGPVQANDSEGNLTIDVPLGEVPGGETVVRAHHESEAWSAFHERHPPARAGMGTWTVEVTLKDAGDEDGVLLKNEDKSQTWSLKVAAEGYSGVLLGNERVPDPNPDPAPDEDPDENADNSTGEENPDTTPDNDTGGNTSVDDAPGDEEPDEVSYEPPSDGPSLSGSGARAAIVIGGAALGVIAAIAIARLKS